MNNKWKVEKFTAGNGMENPQLVDNAGRFADFTSEHTDLAEAIAKCGSVNLIAAAPELLKELVRCMTYIDGVNKAIEGDNLKPELLLNISHSKAREVIKKASGEMK